jgi:hypothetical protein
VQETILTGEIYYFPLVEAWHEVWVRQDGDPRVDYEGVANQLYKSGGRMRKGGCSVQLAEIWVSQMRRTPPRSGSRYLSRARDLQVHRDIPRKRGCMSRARVLRLPKALAAGDKLRSPSFRKDWHRIVTSKDITLI